MVSKKMFALVLTFSLASNFAEKLPDRCSRFEGSYPKLNPLPLVECPQAKFMVKEDLFECYDKNYKESKCKIVHQLSFLLCLCTYICTQNYFRAWIKLPKVCFEMNVSL